IVVAPTPGHEFRGHWSLIAGLEGLTPHYQSDAAFVMKLLLEGPGCACEQAKGGPDEACPSRCAVDCSDIRGIECGAGAADRGRRPRPRGRQAVRDPPSRSTATLCGQGCAQPFETRRQGTQRAARSGWISGHALRREAEESEEAARPR